MIALRRCIGVSAVALSLAVGLTLGTSGLANAATVQGHSCGEKHPMSADYYGPFGFAAPCTADFTVTQSVIARVTIQIILAPGIDRNDPRNWQLDSFHECEGTVVPGDPPQSFLCIVGPGGHTVVVDKALGDKFIDLKVDY